MDRNAFAQRPEIGGVGGIARGRVNLPTIRGILAGEFQADAAIGAGDQDAGHAAAFVRPKVVASDRLRRPASIRAMAGAGAPPDRRARRTTSRSARAPEWRRTAARS